ncbi:MAG: hypothetical protein K2L75_03525 [Muribaculaceae bacterium]|nr:hypothetical protein [Muribaculaceae bacterium]
MKSSLRLRTPYSLTWLSAALFSLVLCIVAPSCGTIRTHAGINHEYSYDFDDGYYKHHHKKHKKHHKKHHKHKHHHHHDD